MSDTPTLSVKPIVRYPREAQVGKTYLMTIDLQPEEDFEWQYEEEEYPIYCQVDSEIFSSKPVGEPVVVLHRFGGTYGEAKILLTAKDKATEGEISITLVNAWGVSVKKIKVQSSLQSIQNVVSEEESTYLKEISDNTTKEQAKISDTSLANALIEIIRQQLTILRSLNMNQWEDNLQKLEKKVISKKINILFLGEFKRGKSTLINALLARELNHEILPASVLPTTAIITEIKWGETPHVRLHYSDDNFVLISIDKLKDYVAINHENIVANEGILKRVEVFLPISFLKSGLEIIDSPGLNDTEVRQRITLNYLKRTDLIFFVISALSPLSQSELEIIKHIINVNKYIIFICNQFDLIPDKDKDGFKAYITNRLADINTNKKNKIFFVSAYEALSGRLQKDSNQFQKSRIIPLEKEIDKLIISGRELKFRRISAVVKESIRESRQAISLQSSLLQSEQEAIYTRYESERVSLARINAVRSRLDRRISSSREDIVNLVSTKASQLFNQVARQIDNWVEEYEVKEPLALKDFLPWNNTSSVRRVASEVTEHLISRMEIEFTQWQNTELYPSIMQYLESVAHDLESISHELSAIHIELDSQPNPNSNVFRFEGSFSRHNIVERQTLLLLTAGLFAFLPLSSTLLITTLVGIQMASVKTKKIKKMVSSQLKHNILSSGYETSQQLATSIADTVDTEVQNTVSQAFYREFESLYEEIKSLRQIKEKGELQLQESKLYLHQLESQLNSIEHKLEEWELSLHKLESISRVIDER